ncbi:hypothetical protein AB4K20DRAFT_1864787 [Rhizopus microsporus]
MHESQVNFACAQVLAGAVLMNVSNGEATLVNTVKVYGGTKLAGIHRELPLSSSMSTSQLNQCMSTSGHTSEVQETVPKLALSRKLREAKSGAVIMSFCHVTTAYKNIHRLDQRQKKKIKSNVSTWPIEPFDLIAQARQLRSQFHHPTTYYFCCASSGATLFSHLQPYAVFTYCDYKGSTKSMNNGKASMIAS